MPHQFGGRQFARETQFTVRAPVACQRCSIGRSGQHEIKFDGGGQAAPRFVEHGEVLVRPVIARIERERPRRGQRFNRREDAGIVAQRHDAAAFRRHAEELHAGGDGALVARQQQRRAAQHRRCDERVVERDGR